MPRRFDYKAIPILINARDLLAPLRLLVTWLLEAGYTRIYVIDNDSTYPPLLEFYEEMRKAVRVILLRSNVGHTALWDMNLLRELEITGPYVWTDPDVVPIKQCPSHVLEYFWEVLQAYPNKSKAGFGLRIDDLPDHYKFKKKVVTWEGQFWEQKITPKLYDSSIDTTFALYRPGSGYDLSGIRSDFPYLARHWPWYEDSDHPSEDHEYYLRHAKAGINNWSAKQLPDWLEAAIRQRQDDTSSAAAISP